MTINQLQYFITVARLENLSRAAETLSINQPALSKSIASLEEEIGAKLFDRQGKKLTLNSNGRAFIERANKILDEVEASKHDILSANHELDHVVHMGISSFKSSMLGYIDEFTKANSMYHFVLDFNIEDGNPVEISNYDILIYPGSILTNITDGKEIGTEKYVLAMPKDHPLAEKNYIYAKDIENENLIFMGERGNHYDYAYAVLKTLNIKFPRPTFTNSREAQLHMIASGMGIGIVPEEYKNLPMPNINIRYIPFDNKRFSRKVYIAFRKDKHLSTASKAFKEHILSQL